MSILEPFSNLNWVEKGNKSLALIRDSNNEGTSGDLSSKVKDPSKKLPNLIIETSVIMVKNVESHMEMGDTATN